MESSNQYYVLSVNLLVTTTCPSPAMTAFLPVAKNPYMSQSLRNKTESTEEVLDLDEIECVSLCGYLPLCRYFLSDKRGETNANPSLQEYILFQVQSQSLEDCNDYEKLLLAAGASSTCKHGLESPKGNCRVA